MGKKKPLKTTNILMMMEEYIRMKEKVTCTEDKPLTLCIVKEGEVQKEVKVNTDEFIQIMHEQAEGETQ